MAADPSSPADRAPARTPRVRRRLRTAAEVQQRRRRLLAYGLLFVSATLMANAVIGENGYLASIRAQREYDRVQADLARVRAENEALRDEKRLILEDDSALEDAARRELGLIRPGEKVVIVRESETP